VCYIKYMVPTKIWSQKRILYHKSEYRGENAFNFDGLVHKKIKRNEMLEHVTMATGQF